MIRNAIKLDDGRFLFNAFGKYQPDLCFLSAQEVSCADKFPWETSHAREFNLEGRRLKTLRGRFFVSKKGTNCFEVNNRGPHLLLEESWGEGGDRGDLSPLEDFLYFRRASSNGGGQGFTYVIIQAEWKQSISMDDI